MEKIKAIVCGLGFVALVMVASFGISSVSRVKGATSFWCLQRIVVNDNSNMSDQLVTQTDLNQFFKANNLVVYPEDKVALSLPLNLCKGSLIKIDRAPVVNLKIGKNESQVRSWAATVADLLKEQNIVMGSKDKINPSLTAKVKNRMSVVLTHWGERIEKKEETIAYDVEREPNADLVVGNTEVSRAGKDGKKEVTYKITSVNGDDISSDKISEKIIAAPVNEIVLYGTKPPVISTRYGRITLYNGGVTSTIYYDTGAVLRITNLANGETTTVIVSCGGSTCGPFDGQLMDLERNAFYSIASDNFNAKVEELAQ